MLILLIPLQAHAQTAPDAFLAAWHQANDQPDNARAAWQGVADQYPKDELGQLARVMAAIALLRQGDAGAASAVLPTTATFPDSPPPNPSVAELRKRLPDAIKGVQARIRLVRLGEKIQLYYDRHVEYPATLDDLVTAGMAKPGDLNDPFGQAYAYDTSANAIAPDVARQRYTLTCTTLKLSGADLGTSLAEAARPVKRLTISTLDPKAGDAYLKLTRPDGSFLPTARIHVGQDVEDFTLWGVYDKFMIVGWRLIPQVVSKE